MSQRSILDLCSVTFNVSQFVYDWLDGKFSYEKAVETARKFKEISLKYNKPVIIAETGYSSCLEASTQGEAIQGQIKAVKGELAGIVIFDGIGKYKTFLTTAKIA